ncbi:hypothetical protein ABZS81_23425 [Streptomyces sp. NPDC005318]|uniref:hypothetical protein n=1 Tax=Streptomyces sp. NPDC005318 TaxID=3157031 RepID=UPI0033A434E8
MSPFERPATCDDDRRVVDVQQPGPGQLARRTFSGNSTTPAHPAGDGIRLAIVRTIGRIGTVQDGARW